MSLIKKKKNVWPVTVSEIFATESFFWTIFSLGQMWPEEFSEVFIRHPVSIPPLCFKDSTYVQVALFLT